MAEGNPIFDSGLAKPDLNIHHVFSPSQLDKWDKCKKLGYYIYRRNFRGEEQDRRMRLGTIVHWMLQRLYQGNSIIKVLDMADDEFTTFEDNALVFKSSGLMYRYQEYWREKEKFTNLGVEQYLLVPFTTPAGRQVYLNGYVDLIYEDKGRLGVMDHKTTAGKFWTVDMVFFDRQLMIYAWMLHTLGFTPFEVSINNIKTSQLGESIEKKLGSDLFSRVIVPLDLPFLKGYMHEVGKTIDEILSLDEYPLSLSRENCSSCLFRHACTMHLEGINPETYLQTNFATERKEVKVAFKGLPG